MDAPHLARFLTLHFAEDADTSRIAAELNGLPEVERAVVVPTALPPTLVAEPAPAGVDVGTEEPLVAPVEPLTGHSSQVVVDTGTGLENQWYVIRCGIDRAWTRSAGHDVVVADVDWGFRTSHQDLAAKIARTYNAVDGTTDVTHGGSVFHGTGVTGLAGAAVNHAGMAGVAYDAEVWGVQADSGTGPSLGGNSWARGIEWVRTANSGGRRKVVILEVQTGSFGNYEQVPSVNAAIRTAIASGVVVCVAAGNGDRDAGLDDSGNPIPETGSILVGATAYDATSNKRAWFSNWGPRITVACPGDSAHDLTCDSSADTAYRNGFGGTSGATPKVAGVSALMLAANPGLSHADVRRILTVTGSALVPDPGKPVGTFLDAAAAVRQAAVGPVGRLEAFARGSDHALWHKWQTVPNGNWSGWLSEGGWIDLLDVGRNADGRLEVFARGSDGAVWHKWQVAPNGTWSGWSSLGGWVDTITVSRNADGRLEVFARGADKALWHIWQTAPNGNWSGWSSLGGWIDLLTAGQNADGRLEVFARGADKALWHIWQTAPNGTWSGWNSLGRLDRPALRRPQRRRPARGLRARCGRRRLAQVAGGAQRHLVGVEVRRRLDRPAGRGQERRRPAGAVRPWGRQGAVAHLADRAQRHLVRMELPGRLDRPARCRSGQRRPAGGLRPRCGRGAVAHLADRAERQLVRMELPGGLDRPARRRPERPVTPRSDGNPRRSRGRCAVPRRAFVARLGVSGRPCAMAGPRCTTSARSEQCPKEQ